MDRKFLEEMGLEKEAIDKVLDANSADIGKQKKLADAAQTKLDTLTAEITAANKTVADMTARIEEMQKSGADAEGLKKQLDEAMAAAAQSKADAEKAQQEAQDKIAAFEYDNALNGYIGGIKFSSEYAKKGFVEDFRAKGFKIEDGKFLGADDYVKTVREKDPGTFAPDENAPKLQITGSTPGLPGVEQTAKKPQTLFF